MEPEIHQPLLIGLVGGIASGKSAVGRLLAEHGATVINADELAHRELAQPDVIEQLVQRWGRGIVDAEGRVNRRQIATYVFGDSDEATNDRKWLERLIHPRVRAAMFGEIQRASDAGARVVVIDVPLLVEAGWIDQCNVVLWIETPLEKRRELAAQRGWAADELARREAAQLPLAEKQTFATHTLANAGTLDDLRAAVDRFWSDAVGK